MKIAELFYRLTGNNLRSSSLSNFLSLIASPFFVTIHFRWAKAQAKGSTPKTKRLKKHKGEKLCTSLLLVGPPGSAKTATVYALAKERGFEILEVCFRFLFNNRTLPFYKIKLKK
jgi:hypothetical protein